MHFFVVGANGFIGRHIVAELLERGHRVTGAARHPAALARMFPAVESVALDLRAPPEKTLLTGMLRGIDVIVNAAGVLDGPDASAVHAIGPKALYDAARAAGIERTVLISAISARKEVDTDYARTKLDGEQVLRDSGLSWTILRPSLVVAKGSFGGTSVLRGLAGLPFVTPAIDLGDTRFSPISASDLARAVAVAAAEERFARAVLEPAGPETVTLDELIRLYRGWLGLPSGFKVRVPSVLVNTAGRIGDALGGGPISMASLEQLAAGNAGDGAAFAKAIGFEPKGISAILSADPADVQDRWHARLFFPGILIKVSLAATWIGSALAGLFHGQPVALDFTEALGLPAALVWPLIVFTCGLDIAAAALLLFDRQGRIALSFQLLLVVGYTVGFTFAMPQLWTDPFGALLKNLAILMLIWVNAVLSDNR